jgi:DNA-binding transcriptional LysR family regulator
MSHLIHPSLRSFVALAQGGTLSSAGETVSRTPSAVSLQIAALEHRLGRKLFVRGARGMRLSDEGQALLRHAKVLLAAAQAAEADLGTKALSGHVRFGMPQDFASSKLASTLQRYRRAHPGVGVTAVIERNATILTLARRGELDLALVISRRAPACATMSVERPSHWYARRGFEWHPPSPLPLVLLDGPCIYRDGALTALESAGIAWTVAFSTASVTAMWAAVAAGVGVTARMDLGAPRTARQVDEDLGLPALRSTVLSVTRPDPRASEPVKALEALVKAALGGLAEGGASRRRR